TRKWGPCSSYGNDSLPPATSICVSSILRVKAPTQVTAVRSATTQRPSTRWKGQATRSSRSSTSSCSRSSRGQRGAVTTSGGLKTCSSPISGGPTSSPLSPSTMVTATLTERVAEEPSWAPERELDRLSSQPLTFRRIRGAAVLRLPEHDLDDGESGFL